MTKEQEETLERLSLKSITSSSLELNDYPNMICLKKDVIEVLSMLEKKDKIINEQLKENVELQKELNEENKRCMILANNNKFKEQVIDLMSEQLAGLTIWNNEKEEPVILGDKEEVKKYYERKAKE